MPDTYTSIQGDTWDMIAYKVYGKESAMVQMIEANNDLVHIAIFPLHRKPHTYCRRGGGRKWQNIKIR